MIRVASFAGLGLLVFATTILLPSFRVNLTPSVPLGIYVAESREQADFVTFCLPQLPPDVHHDPRICSSTNPSGIPVLKRIADLNHDGVVVAGDHGQALDSRVFGPVPPTLILGHWRALLVWNSTREDRDSAVTAVTPRSRAMAPATLVRNVSTGTGWIQ